MFIYYNVQSIILKARTLSKVIILTLNCLNFKYIN